MNKRLLSIILVATALIGPGVFAVLSFHSTALGADIQYSGLVVKVDQGMRQVVIKNPQSGGRIRFTLTDKTEIRYGNDKKSLGDLKSGDAVEVEYEMVSDKYVANKVILKPAGGK